MLASVVEALWVAFPDGSPPTLDQASPWPEVEQAAQMIKGTTWRTARTEVLDAVFDALPWFSAQDFAYWLPALLIDLVATPSRSGWNGDCLIMALTPPAPEDLPERLAALARAHDRGGLDDAAYEAAVRTVENYHNNSRVPVLAQRWDRLTAPQRAAVLGALDYLATAYGNDRAAQAIAGWKDIGGKSSPIHST